MREEILKLERSAAGLEPGLHERLQFRDKVVHYAEEYLERLSDGKAFYIEEEGFPAKHLPMDESPMPLGRLLDIFRENIEEVGLNAASGGHLAYIPGGGLYVSALGDYLADISNKYAGVYYAGPGAVRLENFLVRWMADITGYPGTAAGNITSGGSIANLTSIVTAREAYALKASDFEKCCIYLTAQAHHSIWKAIKVAGLSDAQIRVVEVDDRYRMIPDALVQSIQTDQASGLLPFLVISSAGTTDTGAVDPLEDIADICESSGMWMHVDAAYGGFFLLTEMGKAQFKGIERSDSLVMDPHKGLFLPYGSGAVIIRDGSLLYKAHQFDASYMQDAVPGNKEWSPADLSPELTRPFRGMRMWLPLRLHGLKPFRAALDEKHLLAQYFYDQIQQKPGFVVGPPPELSVLIFRYVPDNQNADLFNKQLVEMIKSDGRIFLSSTTINGIFWIRLAVLSFRTHLRHIDLALELLAQYAANINEEGVG